MSTVSGRINLDMARQAIASYSDVRIRFVEPDLVYAIELAHQHNIYAYDAYVMACAHRLHVPLLSLDARLNRAARAAGITVWEVPP